ncbi:MAG: YceI family protein [Leadbetterella sp.]|nr:YceI family protein [Leadbetterella sp.]
MKVRLFWLAGVLALFAFKSLYDWQVRKDFKVKFTHADADGVFRKLGGTIVFDENQPENAVFDVVIEVKSVETGNPMRDESIAGDTWINAEKYPYITFKATGAVKKEEKWLTSGILALHGVEKPLELPFTFRKEDQGGLFESSFVLKMADYRLSDDPEETLMLEIRVPVEK